MRRVVAVWFPTWPTDRLRRSPGAPSPEGPLITAASDGRRMVVAAADPAALALGIRPGMALAHARAMVPGLAVADADREGDAAALAAHGRLVPALFAADRCRPAGWDLARHHRLRPSAWRRGGAARRSAGPSCPRRYAGTGRRRRHARRRPRRGALRARCAATVVAPGAQGRRSRRCRSAPCACRTRPSPRCGGLASSGLANWPRPPAGRWCAASAGRSRCGSIRPPGACSSRSAPAMPGRSGGAPACPSWSRC